MGSYKSVLDLFTEQQLVNLIGDYIEYKGYVFLIRRDVRTNMYRAFLANKDNMKIDVKQCYKRSDIEAYIKKYVDKIEDKEHSAEKISEYLSKYDFMLRLDDGPGDRYLRYRMSLNEKTDYILNIMVNTDSDSMYDVSVYVTYPNSIIVLEDFKFTDIDQFINLFECTILRMCSDLSN